MATLNRISIIGNLGKDPVTREVGTGEVSNFSVAVTESYKDKNTDQWVKNTTWFDCVAWAYMSTKAQRLSKGASVYIEGKLQFRKWQDKNGVEKISTEIVANTIESLDRRVNDESTTRDSSEVSGIDDVDLDAIPF